MILNKLTTLAIKNLIILFIILSTNSLYSQINFIVIDSISQDPIPFVNIWVEDQDVSTMSNLQGVFSLPKINENKILVLSAVGYVTKKISVNEIGNSIDMAPQIEYLDEVIVSAPSKKRKLTKLVSKIDKSKLNAYLPGVKEKRTMFAKFFQYNDDYQKTPFLQEIRIATRSEIKDAKFNVRLFAINENEEPEGYIYPRNLIATAKKGRNITRIDLSNFNLQIPKEGFFIAIEWLYLSEDSYYWNSYQPEMGFMQLETDRGSWHYLYTKWVKIWKNSGELEYYKNKYNHLAMELVLSN